MKNATTYLGFALLGSMLISFTGKPDCKTNCELLALDDITYIEPTDDFELDFDTAQYLPEGFNAYKGMGEDLTNIVFIESEEEINLGFNSAKYLPIGFDAYEGMVIDLNEINYIEEEEEVTLDFNVRNYLPENFNAYSS